MKEIDAILNAISEKNVVAAKAAATIHVENAARSALGLPEAPSDRGKVRKRRTAV